METQSYVHRKYIMTYKNKNEYVFVICHIMKICPIILKQKVMFIENILWQKKWVCTLNTSYHENISYHIVLQLFDDHYWKLSWW